MIDFSVLPAVDVAVPPHAGDGPASAPGSKADGVADFAELLKRATGRATHGGGRQASSKIGPQDLLGIMSSNDQPTQGAAATKESGKSRSRTESIADDQSAKSHKWSAKASAERNTTEFEWSQPSDWSVKPLAERNGMLGLFASPAFDATTTASNASVSDDNTVANVSDDDKPVSTSLRSGSSTSLGSGPSQPAESVAATHHQIAELVAARQGEEKAIMPGDARQSQPTADEVAGSASQLLDAAVQSAPKAAPSDVDKSSDRTPGIKDVRSRASDAATLTRGLDPHAGAQDSARQIATDFRGRGNQGRGDRQGRDGALANAESVRTAAPRQPMLVFQVPAPQLSAAPTQTAPVVEAPTLLQAAAADAELPTQIVQAMKLQWNRGIGDARIRLQPEYLGELTVSIRVERGVVTASLEADTPVVREWIEGHEALLQQGLAEHGLRLDRLTVSDRESRTESRNESRRGDERPARDEQRRGGRRQQPDEDQSFEVVA